VESTAFKGCEGIPYTIYKDAKYLGNSENPYLVCMGALDVSSLTAVVIHADTRVIAGAAFSLAHNLMSVTFEGNQLITIGNSAFYQCWTLQSIVLPDSVVYIGEQAFYFCDRLSISMGVNVAYIGRYAFYNKEGKTIIYAGTMEQWYAITTCDDPDYRYYARIECSDGNIENWIC
jgi:hypothetical protein